MSAPHAGSQRQSRGLGGRCEGWCLPRPGGSSGGQEAWFLECGRGRGAARVQAAPGTCVHACGAPRAPCRVLFPALVCKPCSFSDTLPRYFRSSDYFKGDSSPFQAGLCVSAVETRVPGRGPHSSCCVRAGTEGLTVTRHCWAVCSEGVVALAKPWSCRLRAEPGAEEGPPPRVRGGLAAGAACAPAVVGPRRAGAAPLVRMASLLAGTLTTGTFFSITGRRCKRRRRRRSERKGNPLALILKCKCWTCLCYGGAFRGRLPRPGAPRLPCQVPCPFCWRFVELEMGLVLKGGFKQYMYRRHFSFSV